MPGNVARGSLPLEVALRIVAEEPARGDVVRGVHHVDVACHGMYHQPVGGLYLRGVFHQRGADELSAPCVHYAEVGAQRPVSVVATSHVAERVASEGDVAHGHIYRVGALHQSLRVLPEQVEA